jgi:hypothetical protein
MVELDGLELLGAQRDIEGLAVAEDHFDLDHALWAPTHEDDLADLGHDENSLAAHAAAMPTHDHDTIETTRISGYAMCRGSRPMKRSVFARCVNIASGSQ